MRTPTLLTSITYRQGTTVVGDVTYQYGAAGNRIAMGSGFGRTGLPAGWPAPSNDAAKQLTGFGGVGMEYDNIQTGYWIRRPDLH
jgi:hypothetical protein